MLDDGNGRPISYRLDVRDELSEACGWLFWTRLAGSPRHGGDGGRSSPPTGRLGLKRLI